MALGVRVSSLLYEPAEGDPYGVLLPQFPFCYPPTVHRYSDWVPVDGWREGPAKSWFIGDRNPMPVLRQALVLVWKGKVLTDAHDRLHRIMWSQVIKTILTPEASLRLAQEVLGGQLIELENE